MGWNEHEKLGSGLAVAGGPVKYCECGCGREAINQNKFVLGHNFRGHKHSEETKKKIGLAGRGRHHSEEAKEKMSEAKKGKPNPFKGKHHSLESKRKISEAGKVFARKYPKKAREMRRKGALITLTSLRRNRPYYINNVPFDSNEERQAMIILCEKFNITPIEGINCHIRVNGGKIDFRPVKKLFIEYHPWDKKGLTSEQYYDQRRKLLDENGFQDCELVVIESLDELEVPL